MRKRDSKNISETILWSKIQEDNQVAFNQVFNSYWKPLYAYTYNILLDSESTEDVLQDVFIKIWTKRKDIEIIDLKSYLFNSARNNAISKLRQDKFTYVHEEVLKDLEMISEVYEEVDYLELKGTIEKSLEKLPPRCRDIFRMSRFEGCSITEIAIHFDISHRTVENQLHVALKHLKSVLKQELFFFVNIMYLLW